MNPAELTNQSHLPHVLGFAGHRTVNDPDRLGEILHREIAAHVDAFGEKSVCYSSAAAGADLLFQEAAAALGCIRWILLPFPAARFAEDFDSPAEWRRAESLMHTAAWHGVLAPAPGEPPADNAYQFTARRILHLAGRMVFFWDGQPPRGPGGTAETIDDARREKIPARIIDAHTLAVSNS